MKRRILAALEALLTLLAAGLSSLLLVGVCLAIWLAIENRPLSDIARLQQTLVTGGGTELSDPSASLALLIISFSIQSLVFAGAGFAMGRWRVDRSDPASRWSVAATLGIALAGGLVAILGTIVISGAMTVLGLEVEEQPWVLALVQAYPRALWLLIPWTVVVGPVAEEVFFRFYMFRFLSQRVGSGFGYAASALAFAVVHFHPPALPLYLFYGFLLAWVYRRTARLMAPIAVHMFINLVSTVTLVLGAAELAS